MLSNNGANMSAVISDMIIGASFRQRYHVNNVVSGQTIAKAWFAVKDNIDDGDGVARIFKTITTVSSTDGHIEDDGAGDRVAALRFDLAPGDTDNLSAGKKYHFGAQILMSGGDIFPLEGGTLIAKANVIQATS
jgi:hypothetical protein